MRRGTHLDPGNRFEAVRRGAFDDGWDAPPEERSRLTTWYVDRTRTILARNDSPDVPFTWSLNPYRGCEHGCAYCYARPSHEYLGFNAGLDFESRILVKPDAPALLEAELRARTWRGEAIMLSGNTDCYQPLEATLRITRGCLEVLARHHNAAGIVTKNFLVTRDLDLLRVMAAEDLITVFFSITTLDESLARALEPRTAVPQRRLRALEMLAAAGVPVGVMVAPVIPGLTDREIPAILAQAAVRGARYAAMQMLRLPGAVEPIFVEWLERERPRDAERVLAHLRDVRHGALNNARFGERMTGHGAQADAVHRLFCLAVEKNGLNRTPVPAPRPRERPQLELFDG